MFIAPKWLSSSVKIEATGSGEFWVQSSREFDSIKISVKGSRSVWFNNSGTKTLSVEISGSGEVGDVQFLVSGSFSVSGSGCVVATAAKNAAYSKSVSGSGKVKIVKD